MTQAPSIRDIIDFWFLPLGHPDHGKPREKSKMWKAQTEILQSLGLGHVTIREE